jgi:hypothetical protein
MINTLLKVFGRWHLRIAPPQDPILRINGAEAEAAAAFTVSPTYGPRLLGQSLRKEATFLGPGLSENYLF